MPRATGGMPPSSQDCPQPFEAAHRSGRAYTRGCRCPEAIQAHERELVRNREEDARRRASESPGPIRYVPTNPDCPRTTTQSHHTAAAYKKGCRCPEGIAAHEEAKEQEAARLRERRGLGDTPVEPLSIPELPAVPVIREESPVGRLVRMTDSRACNGYDVDLFFDPSVEDVAKSICRQCCREDDCLTTALAERQAFGVWGGTTPQERDRMRARMSLRVVA